MKKERLVPVKALFVWFYILYLNLSKAVVTICTTTLTLNSCRHWTQLINLCYIIWKKTANFATYSI